MERLSFALFPDRCAHVARMRAPASSLFAASTSSARDVAVISLSRVLDKRHVYVAASRAVGENDSLKKSANAFLNAFAASRSHDEAFRSFGAASFDAESAAGADALVAVFDATSEEDARAVMLRTVPDGRIVEALFPEEERERPQNEAQVREYYGIRGPEEAACGLSLCVARRVACRNVVKQF